MPPKDVDITFQNGTFHVNPDAVPLSKSQGHTILWDNNTDKDILIKFDKGSPFEGPNPYEVKRGQKQHSGQIVVNHGTTWSYSISFEGGPAMDPQVIVEQ